MTEDDALVSTIDSYISVFFSWEFSDSFFKSTFYYLPNLCFGVL